MNVDGATIIGLLIGIGWYLAYLSKQKNRRGTVLYERKVEDAKDTEEATIEEALEEVVLIDDFEEELEDEEYFDDEG